MVLIACTLQIPIDPLLLLWLGGDDSTFQAQTPVTEGWWPLPQPLLLPLPEAPLILGVYSYSPMVSYPKEQR